MEKSTVEKNVKDGLWGHKPNESKKATGRFWETYDIIFDVANDQIIKGFIICRICKKVDRYNSTKVCNRIAIISFQSRRDHLSVEF